MDRAVRKPLGVRRPEPSSCLPVLVVVGADRQARSAFGIERFSLSPPAAGKIIGPLALYWESGKLGSP